MVMLKLPHGVKSKFGKIDPMNASELTLQDMRRKPYSLWLKYVEPNIVVLGHEDDDCWCWDVKNREHDVSKWVPQVWATTMPEAENPAPRRWNARKFIMELFYEFPSSYSVFRNKAICSKYNCIRPSHMIIAPMNNRDAKYGN